MAQFARRRIPNSCKVEPIEVQGNLSLVEDGCILTTSSSSSSSSNGHGECVLVNGLVSPNTPITEPVSPQESRHDQAVGCTSPPICRTHSYDEVLFDIRKVSAEKIAAQLTLIDLPLFKAITMEEFSDCNWTKKDKHILSPNIFNFIMRFNHTGFWVVREILNEGNVRKRADIVSQFIKISKKLYELNNLHSLLAVVSGLQSGPIDRLQLTWKNVPKKEKATLERLAEFLSSKDNYKNLRDHMDAAKLPCIPHLGMYLTDLTYLFTLNSQQGLSRQSPMMDVIMNMIAYCQNTTYDDLVPHLHIQKYLRSIRYIDELQKFFEDDNYKLSFKIEPETGLTPSSNIFTAGSPLHQIRSTRSQEDLADKSDSGSATSASAAVALSHRRGSRTPQRLLKHQNSSITFSDAKNDLLQGGVEKKLTSLPRNLREPFRAQHHHGHAQQKRHSKSVSSYKSEESLLGVPKPPEMSAAAALLAAVAPTAEVALRRKVLSPSPAMKHKKNHGHRKSQSVGTNFFAALGLSTKPSTSVEEVSPSPTPPPPPPVSLLDGSVLDNNRFLRATNTPTGSLDNISSSASSLDSFFDEDNLRLEHADNTDDEVSLDQLDLCTPIKEGPLKQKVIRKAGKSGTQFRFKSKRWVQLTKRSLLLYRSNPTKKPESSKSKKAKNISLRNCFVFYKERKRFIVTDDIGNKIWFSAQSPTDAREWVEQIQAAITEEQERERREAERSLIKL